MNILNNMKGNHQWDQIAIGDEWFECDAGWDEQMGHVYGLFAGSSEVFRKYNEVKFTSSTWHTTQTIDRVIAERTLGDINSDGVRDETDAEMLWTYIRMPENIRRNMDRVDRTAADVNFDETIDVTDAVLLDHMVNGTAIDVDNIPTDGFAPGFRIAFLNGKDYDNIQYLYTDREGYIRLPNDLFEAPKGKKISYDVGMANQKVRITTPLQVVNVKWIDENEPDYSEPESSSRILESPMSSLDVIWEPSVDTSVSGL